MQKHKFPYNWRLSEAKFTKDKGKVFSCFACGGGSTMGYKLAGFDVIGCNEIDAKVNRCYVANHSPRYNFLEDIRTLRERERERRERERELPPDLYNLDILDGSPPSPLPEIVKRIGVKKRNSERGNLHKFLIRFSLIS